MKKNSTWRALLFSMFSMLISASMLVGSTWAWFADSSALSANTIHAGNLDIEIVDLNDEKKTTPLQFVNVNSKTNLLWEPGATFRTEGFKIKNTGNLSLKYIVFINNTEVSYNMLNEVIDFKLVTVDADNIITDIAIGEEKTLAPGQTSDVMYIQGTMDLGAGLQYQSLALDGISISVFAAQATSEVDIFGNMYDQNAQYGADTTAELGEIQQEPDNGEEP